MLTRPQQSTCTCTHTPACRHGHKCKQAPGAVEKRAAGIFARPGLPSSDSGNRRVLAVLRYLGT
jgi:hypothetical protein